MLPGGLTPPNLLRGSPDTSQQKERDRKREKREWKRLREKKGNGREKEKKERGRGSIKGDFPPPTKGDRRPYA